MIRCFCLVLLIFFTSGCATYRTDSAIEFDTTNTKSITTVIPVGDIDLKNKKVIEIGIVNAVVKKLTLFHDDPTKEQVDIVLAEKAFKMGATAVIDVTYEEGIGWDTWGQIEATGTAIKIKTVDAKPKDEPHK